jgi:type II secretory pathway component GspD/PulD (secretin)
VTFSLFGRTVQGLAILALITATCGAGRVPQSGAPPATIAQFTPPQANVRFSQLYRLRYLSAASVAGVLRRSFANVRVEVIADVNGITVVATAAEQQRIAEALAQLDVPPGTPIAAFPAPSPTNVPLASASGATEVDVLTLHAAIPGINGAPSSSAADIASAVMQALAPSLPDLHITVYASQSQLLLTGSASSIRVAEELIAKLDALPKMVVLDVTIFEVDESVSKNLGLSLTPAVISSTYTETTPAAPANGGTAPPLLGLQPLARTPLSLGLQLNLLIQNGRAKVLADPKLTTLSGRTASIRAGDNIAILTTTGGSVGTVATTQLQTFNTGVQLDITPVINADDFISVTMHPTVNNLASVANGVPQISTRDAQTTVAMREGQTLIIGGLIEDSYNRTEQRIPVLGYLPIVGPLFTQTTVTGERDELIITITPHIIDPLTVAPAVGPALTELPAPIALPTLAPSTVLPQMQAPASPAPARFGNAPPSPGAFVYGQRPASLPTSGPHDAPRIFYASATPQLVGQGTTISIEAVTTPNVARVTVQLGAANVSLTASAPGRWDATVPFSMPNTSQMTPQSLAVLSAARADGVATSITIPLTLMR